MTLGASAASDVDHVVEVTEKLTGSYASPKPVLRGSVARNWYRRWGGHPTIDGPTDKSLFGSGK